MLSTQRSKSLLAFWRAASDGQNLPHMSALDPIKIAAELPFVAVLQPIAEREMRFRLFGTGLVEMLGGDLTGTNYFDMYEGEPLVRTSQALKFIREERVASVTLVNMSLPNEQNCLVEVAHLPFVDDENNVSRLLMGFSETQPWPIFRDLEGDPSRHIVEKRLYISVAGEPVEAPLIAG